MLSHTLELQAQQRRLELDLAGERAALSECKEELLKASSAFKCQVCFTCDVSHVMVPCGHTICEVCIGSMQGQLIASNRCPFCRTNIISRVKFYLPDTEE